MIFIQFLIKLAVLISLSVQILPSAVSHYSKDVFRQLMVSEAISNLFTRGVADGELGTITLLRNENYQLPYNEFDTAKIALLSLGDGNNTPLVWSIKKHHAIDHYIFSEDESFEDAAMMAASLKKKYDKLIISLYRDTSSQTGLTQTVSPPALSLTRQLREEMRTSVIVFGDLQTLSQLEHSPALIFIDKGDSLTQTRAGDFLFHSFDPMGKLPSAAGKTLPKNSGLSSFEYRRANVSFANPEEVNVNGSLLYKVDSIALDGIANGAFPGCQILAMHNGEVFYQKAFGTLGYDNPAPVGVNTIFDLASCTKICATTLSVMKLYDEGKLKLNGTLGDYLPWLRNTDKARLTIKDVMLHQAGFIPDFLIGDLLLPGGDLPRPDIFHMFRDDRFGIHVADNIYMRNDYLDTIKAKIRNSRLGAKKYVYSDIDFQLMGDVVEEISGVGLDEFVKKNFYDPMGLVYTGFRPRERYALSQIAPTECEKEFRLQCLHGDVHDPRAALKGGVDGHAGLFSNTYDLAALMGMMLNGGVFNGISYLKPATIQLFTSYQSNISRRGIGFDKPSKDQRINARYPYPSKYASPETYGHTGYTGTCVWVDPKYDFVYVFLSNRVNPDGGSNLKISHMEIRGKIQDAFYEAMGAGR